MCSFCCSKVKTQPAASPVLREYRPNICNLVPIEAAVGEGMDWRELKRTGAREKRTRKGGRTLRFRKGHWETVPLIYARNYGLGGS